MTAGPVNRALLESFFQQPGQIYDDTKTESSFDVIADQIDDNYNQLATLINAGVMSPYIANAQAQSIINSNFSINQRGKTGTVTLTAGQYGHDRWKAGAAGCTYTFATVNNVTTITIIAGSLVQVIEGLNLYSGTYTLSWTGTAQGKIGAGAYGATGVTATVVGGTNLAIEFNSGTLSNVGFNFGSTSLPFQPKSYNQENLDSLRYRWQSWADGVVPSTVGSFSGYASTTNALITNVRFPVPMRITPTISIQQNNVPNQVRNTASGALVTVAPSSYGVLSHKGFMFLSVGGTPFTVGQYYDFDIVADAEL